MYRKQLKTCRIPASCCLLKPLPWSPVLHRLTQHQPALGEGTLFILSTGISYSEELNAQRFSLCEGFALIAVSDILVRLDGSRSWETCALLIASIGQQNILHIPGSQCLVDYFLGTRANQSLFQFQMLIPHQYDLTSYLVRLHVYSLVPHCYPARSSHNAVLLISVDK